MSAFKLFLQASGILQSCHLILKESASFYLFVLLRKILFICSPESIKRCDHGNPDPEEEA
jgi:hypothetical protein